MMILDDGRSVPLFGPWLKVRSRLENGFDVLKAEDFQKRIQMEKEEVVAGVEHGEGSGGSSDAPTLVIHGGDNSYSILNGNGPPNVSSNPACVSTGDERLFGLFGNGPLSNAQSESKGASIMGHSRAKGDKRKLFSGSTQARNKTRFGPLKMTGPRGIPKNPVFGVNSEQLIEQVGSKHKKTGTLDGGYPFLGDNSIAPSDIAVVNQVGVPDAFAEVSIIGSPSKQGGTYDPTSYGSRDFGEKSQERKSDDSLKFQELARPRKIKKNAGKSESLLALEHDDGLYEVSVGVSNDNSFMENSDQVTGEVLVEISDGRGGGPYHAPQIPMKLLSWHCRGLGQARVVNALQGLVIREDPDVLFLMETKVVDIQQHLISVSFSNILRCAKWLDFFVYGPPSKPDRKIFWEELALSVSTSQGPWALIGDLNSLANSQEKFGGVVCSQGDFSDLSDFLMISGGIDLGSVGNFLPGLIRGNSLISSRNVSIVCFQLVSKLGNTRKMLAKWNRDYFGMCESKLKLLDSLLLEVQARCPSPENSLLEADILLEIDEVSKRQCSIWRQKSREIWLKEGDRNTRFFHASTVIRRKRNFIGAITNNGIDWISGRTQIGDYFINHFGDVFCSSNPSFGNALSNLIAPCISGDMNSDSSRVPSPEEVRLLVWSMGPLKSPGPDGMPGFFDRFHWDTVGESVVDTVREFFMTGDFVQSLNRTFIVLIPKKVNAVGFDDFRPISLCNFVYKVISKILANRLKIILPDLISPFQSAFVPGRDVLARLLAQKEDSGLIHGFKNTDLVSRNDITDALRFRLMTSEDKFLGNPLFFTKIKIQDFSFVIEKVKNRPKEVGGLGLKKSHDLNLAFIAKLGWALAKGDSSPWCKVFLAKYCKRDLSFWNAPVPPLASWGARGIFASRDLIRKESCWMLGNGLSIDLWSSPWVPWLEWDEFLAAFNPMIHSQDGKFSIKAAYRLITKNRHGGVDRLYKTLWKSPFGERVKLFLWKVRRDILPCGQRLQSLFGNASSCVLCDGDSDSLVHFFFHCPVAQFCWFRSSWSIRSDLLQFNSSRDIVEWILFPPFPDNVDLDRFSIFAALLCYHMWSTRNKCFHEGVRDPPEVIFKGILHSVSSFDPKDCKVPPTVACDPPAFFDLGSVNRVNLFVDAAVRDNMGFYVVLAIDSSGKVLEAYAGKEVVVSPLDPEVRAILNAFSRCLYCGWPTVMIFSDCKVAVDAILARHVPSWQLYPTFVHLFHLCNLCSFCNVSWISRVNNGAAHKLAAWAAS
uniref:Reverse transcriptase zinc-binding domain-containing protein n=1 Tax=Cannabis sativa TaxID=3483 RepID=A0A803PU22_CANSA